LTFAFHTQLELSSRLHSTCNLSRFALTQVLFVPHFCYIYKPYHSVLHIQAEVAAASSSIWSSRLLSSTTAIVSVYRTLLL